MKTSMFVTLGCTFLLSISSIYGDEERVGCRPEEIFSFAQGYPVEDALFFVKLGSYCREKDKLEEAESYLCKALEQDPDFSQAYTELGLLCLQRKEFRRAKEYFYRSLQIAPCDQGAMEGLEQGALEWEKEKCTQRRALEIYHDLLCCDPENPNLLFRIGRLYAWLDDRKCGEYYLLLALKSDPDFSDAEIQLGLLYFWEKRWDEAEIILCKFPESQAAQEARAKIFLSHRCYREALEVLTPLLCKEEKEFGFNTLYAQTLMLLRRYYDSERFHRFAVCEDPCNEKSWNHLFEVKKYTHPTFYLNANYIEAKEDDPDLDAPVVRDYYQYNKAIFTFPTHYCLQWSVRGIGGTQREKDIFPPTGTNYYVAYAWGGIHAKLFLPADWALQAFAAGKEAWPARNGFFPFHATARFEPGAILSFTPEKIGFFAAAYRESFITKNFAHTTSELLSRTPLTANLGYRFSDFYQLAVRGDAELIFYQDSIGNRQKNQAFWAKIEPPPFPDYVFLKYLFEHKGFDQVTTNYYSFKNQWRHTAGVGLHTKTDRATYVELLYEKGWELTRNLVQPIGSFISTAAKRFLHRDRVALLLTHRVHDCLRVELSGHYFRSTLPYRDWGGKGSLLMEF